jgi:NAD(P)H-hydrate epimerase
LLVDALFGTGLNKPVGGKVSEVISVINESGLPVVSVDIPSGISSDNGQVMGEAVRADCTVTFGLPKRGHFLHPGAEFSGNLFVADIGFPKDLVESETLNVGLVEKNDVSGRVPERRNYSHKGDYGHILIVAGSRGKTGAALMAAKACLRTGAGLVTVGIPESLAELFQSRVTEEMTLILPDKGDGTLSWKASLKILDFIEGKADVLVVGPGMGVSRETEKIMKSVIENSACPMVIDADGINSLRGDRKILTKAVAPLILTPHTGEMARLLQAGAGMARKKIELESPDSELKTHIERDRIGTALSFAVETRTFLVLKGVPTVIATPEGRAFLNSTGNPGMASAGTGDVLTGMISGFLGQNKNPLDACILGVYMHGLAGDIAADEKGEHSVIATDMIERIPAAFYSLRRDGVNS